MFTRLVPRFTSLPCLLLGILALAPPSVGARPRALQAAVQSPADSIAGVTNFQPVDANFALAGATTREALPTLKQRGFKTVVNLRMAAEPGADVEAEGDEVRKLGMAYFSIPVSPFAPDVAVVGRFLDVVRDTGNQPIYIHCSAGVRAKAFWLIKRVLVDNWTTEKALAEADSLKLENQTLRKFALAYIEDHK
jgi:protein tyrosine phosphatase (PTP) superfamily phosphohydrolase (DUF442 family)